MHEIVDIGGVILKALHVNAHAFAEFFGAQIGFKHRQDVAALGVGDPVKGIIDVGIALDRITDLSRILKAV